jgi:hypothetical protein
MKTNQYRSHTVAAALAATIVTTVLVGTLVESFEPAQLIQFDGNVAGDQIVAFVRRTQSSTSQA